MVPSLDISLASLTSVNLFMQFETKGEYYLNIYSTRVPRAAKRVSVGAGARAGRAGTGRPPSTRVVSSLPRPSALVRTFQHLLAEPSPLVFVTLIKVVSELKVGGEPTSGPEPELKLRTGAESKLSAGPPAIVRKQGQCRDQN
ncbi:hypothetical protein EVAR_11113_1 [Eumeta japonica]|uniref:Uncharacterized protein n=1 Tax=Eumeta variegata TaxID=151549 RepID=A0A4C1U432_EUMVA|nr:hypothetical protein EVAR_11113_1 [Eumeta japonica]